MTRMKLPPVLMAPLTAYWLLTRRISPRDRNDLFYGRFSVVLLSVSQLLILCLLGRELASDVWLAIGKRATGWLVVLGGSALAVMNSIALYAIDDDLHRKKYQAKVSPSAKIILVGYFAFAVICGIQLFASR